MEGVREGGREGGREGKRQEERKILLTLHDMLYKHMYMYRSIKLMWSFISM